jgi:tryptophan-rich sensory protein
MNPRSAVSLALFVLGTAAAAFFAAGFRPGGWYEALSKPAWTPPNWLFAPVWSVLYLAIAIAGWLVWRRSGASLPLAVWIGQLTLNAAWSWLFFGLHRPALALADIVALLVVILVFIAVAGPVSRAAALLFVPYGLWVLYATALNASIVLRNPSAA